MMVQEVEPLKNIKDINKIKQYLLGKKNKRDYCIFVVGINVGLRASDLLSLKIEDVTDGNIVFDEVTITESKTGKKEKICISDEVQTQYRAYKIDDVIDEMIIQLLRRTKALQSGEFINYKYQTEWKRIQGSLNHAKTMY